MVSPLVTADGTSVQLATSGLEPFSVAEQSVPDASEKVTVPVGVPAPGEATATVALSVTLWPTTAEDGLALALVVVASWPMVTLVEALELPKKFESPE
jgi:hypothetical protein